jgi:3-methyladenine DNA glycosylase/8-oxoguanine DNA glycosylase
MKKLLRTSQIKGIGRWTAEMFLIFNLMSGQIYFLLMT